MVLTRCLFVNLAERDRRAGDAATGEDTLGVEDIGVDRTGEEGLDKTGILLLNAIPLF